MDGLSAPRQRVCEKLVLDDPQSFLSKTPEEIAAVTRTLQAGTPFTWAVMHVSVALLRFSLWLCAGAVCGFCRIRCEDVEALQEEQAEIKVGPGHARRRRHHLELYQEKRQL
jgi:hypothetical protein